MKWYIFLTSFCDLQLSCYLWLLYLFVNKNICGYWLYVCSQWIAYEEAWTASSQGKQLTMWQNRLTANLFQLSLSYPRQQYSRIILLRQSVGFKGLVLKRRKNGDVQPKFFYLRERLSGDVKEQWSAEETGRLGEFRWNDSMKDVKILARYRMETWKWWTPVNLFYYGDRTINPLIFRGYSLKHQQSHRTSKI